MELGPSNTEPVQWWSQRIGNNMRNLLSYIVENDSRKEKIGQLKDTTISILRVISQAADFIRAYVNRSTASRWFCFIWIIPSWILRTEKLWDAHFHGSRLTEFKSTFANLKEDFEKSRNFQTYFDIYHIRENLDQLVKYGQLKIGENVQFSISWRLINMC